MTTINYDIYILSALDVSDINILDTINLVWKKVNPIGTQNIGASSSSILLPDNKIIYIDSSNTGNLAETTTGTIPPKKDGGSAVLGLDALATTAPATSLSSAKLLALATPTPPIAIGTSSFLSKTSSFLSPTSSSLSPKVSSEYNDQNSNKISTGVTVILLICGGAFIIVVSILLRKCNNRMNRMIYGSNYTIQIPVPASLINNDINRNVVYYNQANSNNSNPRQEIVQQPVAINNVNDRRNRNEVRQPIVIYDVNNRRNRNEVQQPVAINNVKDRRNRNELQQPVAINNVKDRRNRNELQQPVVINNVKDRRNRNENGDNNYQTERNNYYPGQEIVQQPEVINNDNRNESNYHPGQEIVQPPAPASIINTNYNHGRESVPIANYEIQILKQEIQDLKQIILQNNKQSTSSTSNN
ncbi:unnamed protein product [Rhizophagus irregularis]|nr:unnamed protein product [Rhizophagus irregularis]